MTNFHLITVGQLKNPELETIEMEYLKRFKNFSLILHHVKSKSEDKNFEGQQLLQKFKHIQKKEKNNKIVLLSEWGEQFTSPEFAQYLDKNFIQQGAAATFMVAGAEGFSEQVLSQDHKKISLSRMTFPHKLAKIMFIEQLYRAQCILSNHPYHN